MGEKHSHLIYKTEKGRSCLSFCHSRRDLLSAKPDIPPCGCGPTKRSISSCHRDEGQQFTHVIVINLGEARLYREKSLPKLQRFLCNLQLPHHKSKLTILVPLKFEQDFLP
jgi:hypothetical protein